MSVVDMYCEILYIQHIRFCLIRADVPVPVPGNAGLVPWFDSRILITSSVAELMAVRV